MRPDAQFTHAHMVRFERPLSAAREKLWALLTTPALLPGWYGDGMIKGSVLTYLPVMDEFMKLNAMGWHTFLDMVDAAARGEPVELARPT